MAAIWMSVSLGFLPALAFAHNIETVERLFPKVRPQGDYKRSLHVLVFYSKSQVAPVKSRLMLGLGERWEDVIKTMEDLKEVGVWR